MKQKYIFILLTVLSAVFSCTLVDEGQLETDAPAEEKVHLTFSAVISEADESKTILEGAVGDGFRRVLWQPGDAIGVCRASEDMMYIDNVERFVSTADTETESTEFEGDIVFASRYKAFYPYSETVRDSMEHFIFNLPVQQNFVQNSFDPAAAPMVANARYGEIFKFKNLCGVLALQLKGEETVKSIVFSGRDEAGKVIKVAGKFEVNAHEETPQITPSYNAYESVELNCETPVQLDPNAPTSFHIVLPPATYSRFTIMIVTEDGKVMFKEGTNPITINRSKVRPTADLMYVETLSIDLSESGTANSYIVSKSGLYSFDATVIGNGAYGFVDGVQFHTDSPKISPVKAEILWQDRDGVITSATCDGCRVNFIATGVEGNALIAVKDENGEILWSWHIWVTDQPQEQVYVNSTGSYPMMDRNLGATRADRGIGNEWYEAKGLLYQWGRKDPFGYKGYFDGMTANEAPIFNIEYVKASLTDAIKNPTYLYSPNNENWCNDHVDSLWNRYQKTIYDPCPVGYTVSHTDVWRSFMSDETNKDYFWDDGWNVVNFQEGGLDFIYDGVNSTYYPATNGYHDYWSSQVCYMWSSEEYGDDVHFSVHSKALQAIYYSWDSWDFSFNGAHERSYSFAVRCMKDSGYDDTKFPLLKMTSVTDMNPQGATVSATLIADGGSEITERGFVWGTEEHITLGNAEYQSVDATFSDFSLALSGLNNATRYYVRAYAKNETGVGYSDVKSFYTPWEGNAYDLSSDGTANSYIVPAVYAEYSFNASVKGNSTEPVGNIASVDVLWESTMNYGAFNIGDIIESVTIKGDKVHLMLPFEPQPGNALVAVKDEYGTILWSWHIWVVDYDPQATQQKLSTGAVIMDRNLGAIAVGPETITTFGLYYQWGRKDPFPLANSYLPSDAIYQEFYGSYNSIESVTHVPTYIYDDITWNEDKLWDTDKTKYDPCPFGWRVPDVVAWEGLYTDGDTGLYGYFQLAPEHGTPTVYIPKSGYSYGGSFTEGTYSYAYLWLLDKRRVYINDWNSYLNIQSDVYVSDLAPIRCMKDMKHPASGDGNDLFVDDKYEW